jgi:hypothetical protein
LLVVERQERVLAPLLQRVDVLGWRVRTAPARGPAPLLDGAGLAQVGQVALRESIVVWEMLAEAERWVVPETLRAAQLVFLRLLDHLAQLIQSLALAHQVEHAVLLARAQRRLALIQADRTALARYYGQFLTTGLH